MCREAKEAQWREQAAQLKTRDAIRAGTAFAAEFYLSGKVFSATERLFDVAQHKAIQLSEKIGTLITQESILLRTTEGLEVKLNIYRARELVTRDEHGNFSRCIDTCS